MIYIPMRRESVAEQAFVSKVKRDMPWWEIIKLNLQGNSGWPDRMCIGRFGLVVFIEFKRPNGRVSERQKEIHQWLSDNGHKVYVCTTVPEAINVLKDAYNEVLAARLSKDSDQVPAGKKQGSAVARSRARKNVDDVRSILPPEA